jgi:hypothetical protein
MEELHLVLHKVKGRPAIDVAQRLLLSCGRELWWVPTSGHRVYPYKCVRLDESLAVSADMIEGEGVGTTAGSLLAPSATQVAARKFAG